MWMSALEVGPKEEDMGAFLNYCNLAAVWVVIAASIKTQIQGARAAFNILRNGVGNPNPNPNPTPNKIPRDLRSRKTYISNPNPNHLALFVVLKNDVQNPNPNHATLSLIIILRNVVRGCCYHTRKFLKDPKGYCCDPTNVDDHR